MQTTKWLEKNYSEEMDDLFPVYQKNKKITVQDIYDSFGATLHVLTDNIPQASGLNILLHILLL